jgi:hypothetical protein
MFGTNADVIYVAKLVDFNGFYSQVVPNWEKIIIEKNSVFIIENINYKHAFRKQR